MTETRPLFEQPEIHQRRWFLLGVMCLSLVMVVMSVSGINVALPSMQQSLDANATDLQWIVDSYAIVFAGLPVPEGWALRSGLGGVAGDLAWPPLAGGGDTMAAIVGIEAGIAAPVVLALIGAVALFGLLYALSVRPSEWRALAHHTAAGSGTSLRHASHAARRGAGIAGRLTVRGATSLRDTLAERRGRLEPVFGRAPAPQRDTASGDDTAPKARPAPVGRSPDPEDDKPAPREKKSPRVATPRRPALWWADRVRGRGRQSDRLSSMYLSSIPARSK